MGSGVAYTAARAGINVVLLDTTDQVLERAQNEFLRRHANHDLKKEKISDDKAILKNTSACTNTPLKTEQVQAMNIGKYIEQFPFM